MLKKDIPKHLKDLGVQTVKDHSVEMVNRWNKKPCKFTIHYYKLPRRPEYEKHKGKLFTFKNVQYYEQENDEYILKKLIPFTFDETIWNEVSESMNFKGFYFHIDYLTDWFDRWIAQMWPLYYNNYCIANNYKNDIRSYKEKIFWFKHNSKIGKLHCKLYDDKVNKDSTNVDFKFIKLGVYYELEPYNKFLLTSLTINDSKTFNNRSDGWKLIWDYTSEVIFNMKDQLIKIYQDNVELITQKELEFTHNKKIERLWKPIFEDDEIQLTIKKSITLNDLDDNLLYVNKFEYFKYRKVKFGKHIQIYKQNELFDEIETTTLLYEPDITFDNFRDISEKFKEIIKSDFQKRIRFDKDYKPYLIKSKK